eukprot:CAMPEP_0197656454 /NCGR_PEP_ID=MMETSP1338-20131121/41930_1 /TAXON_ID=43686 ORGANISM="Pelagodinium beii, Strain RCC1491" /NCGR_SAMPLE_ID=MMETSP1338 /ASSEMBLY_ACC=CAM_ASM_000754 /LENGTH=132 /DNA_ID=CAMNT_0043232455 /DNA_START=36 /DNA_END=434 /DNA_ORIENTATION=+
MSPTYYFLLLYIALQSANAAEKAAPRQLRGQARLSDISEDDSWSLLTTFEHAASRLPSALLLAASSQASAAAPQGTAGASLLQMPVSGTVNEKANVKRTAPRALSSLVKVTVESDGDIDDDMFAAMLKDGAF